MASCPSCGSETRDGDWTCRTCGSPVARPGGDLGGAYEEPVRDAGYYQAPTIYGTTAPTIRPLQAGRSGGLSGLVWLVLIAAVAIVTAASVWFFVFRSTPSDFTGTWKGALPAGASRAANDTTMTVARDGGGYVLSFEDSGGQTFGPYSVVDKGDRIETRFEYAGSDIKQRVVSGILTGVMDSLASDFRMVLYFEGGALYVKAEGKPKPGVDAAAFGKPSKLVKAD
jgi:hypothetical protein